MMDTTPKYIKMCEMAEEIQEGWKPTQGDFYQLGCKRDKTPAICILGCHWEKCEGCHYEVNSLKDECVWLLRQDQSQEMVDDGVLFFVLEEFHQFVFLEYGPYCAETFNSREQLWLAFVMHEKFNKVWRNDRWKKLKI